MQRAQGPLTFSARIVVALQSTYTICFISQRTLGCKMTQILYISGATWGGKWPDTFTSILPSGE